MTRLSRRTAYESRWLRVYLDRVRLPDGTVLEDFHVVDGGPGTVSVLVEDEGGRILLGQTYRPAVDETLWELPGGGLEVGEGPLEAARREALEETGLETSGHEMLVRYYPDTGRGSGEVHVVRCRAGAGCGPRDGEVGILRWVTREEAWHLVRHGGVRSGATILALLFHLADRPGD